MSCRRTQKFLASRGIEDEEVRSATRNPVAGPDALELLAGITELLVAKGRRTQRFDLTGADRPEDDALLALLLGRSGKLRAPTMRVGSQLLVGYSADMLESVFG